MEWTHWKTGDTPIPADPLLVEGLPGIGHVGQLVAQHLVDALGGTLHAEIFSPDFPPQAILEPDGTARLAGLRLWSIPADGDAPALVVLTGDTQPLTPHGQFEVTRAVLDRVEAAGCRRLYTLGGVGAREDPERVFAAGTDPDAVAAMTGAGAHVDELGPEGGIIGASGVFLGLARVRDWTGGCLIGESDGSIVDVEAGRRVLAVLSTLLGRTLTGDGMDEGARRIEEQLQMLDEVRYYAAAPDAEHHYIG